MLLLVFEPSAGSAPGVACAGKLEAARQPSWVVFEHQRRGQGGFFSRLKGNHAMVLVVLSYVFFMFLAMVL